ncbi:hypothetical protein P7K49_023482, partial [Saguinus oedipus]
MPSSPANAPSLVRKLSDSSPGPTPTERADQPGSRTQGQPRGERINPGQPGATTHTTERGQVGPEGEDMMLLAVLSISPIVYHLSEENTSLSRLPAASSPARPGLRSREQWPPHWCRHCRLQTAHSSPRAPPWTLTLPQMHRRLACWAPGPNLAATSLCFFKKKQIPSFSCAYTTACVLTAAAVQLELIT